MKYDAKIHQYIHYMMIRAFTYDKYYYIPCFQCFSWGFEWYICICTWSIYVTEQQCMYLHWTCIYVQFSEFQKAYKLALNVRKSSLYKQRSHSLQMFIQFSKKQKNNTNFDVLTRIKNLFLLCITIYNFNFHETKQFGIIRNVWFSKFKTVF